MEENKCEECGCDPCECEETVEEIIENNDVKLNALIELLIYKGVISEEEFDKKVDETEDDMYENDSEEEKSE